MANTKKTNKINFLEDFQRRLIKLASSSKEYSFRKLYETLSEEKLKLHAKIDFSELLQKANEYKNVLNKVAAIVYKPLITVTTNEIVLRAEQSTALSTDSFRQTLQDPRIWRQKGGAMSPEYVHTTETLDTIITYENKFIIILIKFIHHAVSELFKEAKPELDSLEKYFESKGLTYGRYSIFNEFQDFSYPYDGIFVSTDSDEAKLYKQLKYLMNLLKKLEGSTFYKTIEPYAHDRNILPTNILVHNELYSFCYKFYKNNFLLSNKDEARDIAYYNYTLVSLFNYLASTNVAKTSKSNNAKMWIDSSKRLRFTEISFKKGLFAFFIKEDEENLAFTFETHLIEKAVKTTTKVSDSKVAKYYIQAAYGYTYDNQKSIDSNFKARHDHYNDCVLITMNNLVLEYNSVLNLNYSKEDHYILFKNLVSSFSMLFTATNTEIYNKICPVCGQNHINLDKPERICGDCGASYTLENVLDEELIWIKAFRRVTNGRE